MYIENCLRSIASFRLHSQHSQLYSHTGLLFFSTFFPFFSFNYFHKMVICDEFLLSTNRYHKWAYYIQYVFHTHSAGVNRLQFKIVIIGFPGILISETYSINIYQSIKKPYFVMRVRSLISDNN